MNQGSNGKQRRGALRLNRVVERRHAGTFPLISFPFPIILVVLILAACTNLSGEPRIVSTIPPATPAPPTQTPPPEVGFPLTTPDLANGARIYADNCAACHGAAGRGDGPVARETQGMIPGDFTDPASARLQTPHEWYRTITRGRIENLMPPWLNALTEQERWDVALYTYTLHYQPAALEIGERIYQDCAECHGQEGRGDGPQAEEIEQGVKNLSDSVEMITLSDESMFKMVTQGFEDIMPSYAELSEDERWAVVAHARTLSLMNTPQSAAEPTAVPGTTDALTNLTSTALVLQIHAVGDALDIIQAIRVRNLSETLAFSQNIARPDGTTAALALNLPDGAALSATTGVGGLSEDGKTAYVLEPLPPLSEHLFVLNYTLPFSAGETVSVPVDMVVAGPVRVLVRPLEMRVRSELLPSLGEQTLGTELYNGYGDQIVLRANTLLSFVLEGTSDPAPVTTDTPASTSDRAAPAGSGDAISPTVLGALAVTVAVLIAGAVGVYAYRTRTLTPEARILQIAREIGRIDAEHKAGTLNHDLWHRRRAALKSEQMALRGYPEEKKDD